MRLLHCKTEVAKHVDLLSVFCALFTDRIYIILSGKKSVVSKNAAVITRNNSAFARECGDIMCMQWTNSQLLGVNVRFEGITYTVNIIIEAFIEQRVKGTFFAARCSQPVAATVVDF